MFCGYYLHFVDICPIFHIFSFSESDWYNKQQHHRVSAYLFMHLSRVRNGLCQTLYFFPVCSHVLLYVPGRSFAFPCIIYASELTLLEIICKLCAILCVVYGLKSAFVVDLPIPFVINVIASNIPYMEVSYIYKWELEFLIIYFVSLLIGI